MKRVALGLVAVALSLVAPAAADTTPISSKALFGDLQARQIGPALMSGRINDLEGHPNNSRILYVGAAGGGVWRSRDGGATFQPIFDEHVQSIGVVKVDPVDPDKIIWVGTGETWTRNSVSTGDGLFRSDDGGVNWKPMGFGASERISSIEIDPRDHDRIYVGVLGALWSDGEERGVYRSDDGGGSWKQILYVDAGTGCSELIVDPGDPNVLYASMWEFRRSAWSFSSGGKGSALYKSTDGGESWHKIHNGFPQGDLGRIAVAVAPSAPNVVYAVLEAERKEESGLYRSDDGGANWVRLNGDFGLVVRPFYFSRIVVDPRDPDVVVKAGFQGSISHDGGKTFKNLGWMHPDIHDILFDLEDSDRIYVATDGGLYRSWDGGGTMEIVSNLPLSQFYHVSVDDEEPYNVYGGLQDNGSWHGPSRSPGGIEARDWNVIGFGDGFRVLRHHSKRIIYSEMQSGEAIWRYDMDRDEFKSIQPLPEPGDPKLRFNWNTAIALSDTQPDRFYAGAQFLYRSEDMGDTWEKISPDLTSNDPAKQKQENTGGLSQDNSGAENYETIFTIAESPLDEQVIWVGTDDGRVQLTTDGGEHWRNVVKSVPDLPKDTWVYHIEASVHDRATAYAVFDGHTRGDMTPYVYRTRDLGKSWTSLATAEIEGFARCLQEDYENPDLLFLGTERGLFITIDGGGSWHHFTNNMPPVAVHHLTLQRRKSDLVMATHGRGIIILDDISPLRRLTPEVLGSDLHIFPPRPTVMEEESGIGGYSSELEFVGPNPDRDVRIVYYMKKRHIFGKMKMQIFDAEGRILADLVPGKSKGINVVTWNYRLRRPKSATGGNFDWSAFSTPRVPAGTYRAVFTKGKQQYETEFILLNDPDSPYTEQERAELHQATMELYDMVQELAYLVYRVDSYLEAAKGIEKRDRNTRKLIEKLSELKETLVITEGDNYVGQGEPRLREDLGKLYSRFTGSFRPPSAPELANKRLLEKRLSEAQEEFRKIRGKQIARFIEAGHEVPLQSFEEFVETP
jgi:photosystem II stability/assembly factor-like uncharacterized protein